MGNPVVQWQILAKEPAKAEAFYTSLFDWKVNANNALKYRRLETGEGRGIDGGIWPAPEAGHSMVQLFIEVRDVAAHLEKAVQLGATVLIPPQKLPDGDELAILLDPVGISFGLYKHRQTI
jgi:predicted enzyme related to lactoylglutathione lyase